MSIENEITYDTIIHDTIHKFDIVDRIRILFNGKLLVSSRINTKERCNVIGSMANTYTTPIFKIGKKHTGLMSDKN